MERAFRPSEAIPISPQNKRSSSAPYHKPPLTLSPNTVYKSTKKHYIPIDDGTFNMVLKSMLYVRRPQEARHITLQYHEPIYAWSQDWDIYVWDDNFSNRFSTAFVELTGLPKKICCTACDYKALTYRLYRTMKWKYSDLLLDFPPHREEFFKPLYSLQI